MGSVDENSEIRVWLNKDMSSSGLSMARSLGDHTSVCVIYESYMYIYAPLFIYLFVV